VVTAFIMMSDAKDEIDYEWVGVELNTTQTNYYWQGVEDYHNSANVSMNADTFNYEHEYTIDWTPDTITWLVDGQVGRVKSRKDTWNATSQSYMYPQTPARVQLSIWPGGLASNGQGTIDWAGGLIDWNAPDITKPGYFYAIVSSVTVECYNEKLGQGSGTNSWEYSDKSMMNSSVINSNDPHILDSFVGNGNNLTAGYVSMSSTTIISTSTNSAGKATVVTQTIVPTQSNVDTVPGLSGAGFGSGDNRGGDSESSSSSSGTGSNSGSSSGSGSSGSDSSSGGFSQGTSSTNTGKSGGVVVQPDNVVHGSMLAVVIALVAMIVL